MSWILGGIYCGLIWLIFAKLKLVRLSLPLALVAGSVGPLLIIALLVCAQYFHPMTSNARVFKRTIPIIPQVMQPGRITEILVQANTPVKKGDVLFRIDAVPYENAVARFKVSVAEAKQSREVAAAAVKLAAASRDRAVASLDFATADRDRKTDLFESKAISDEDYELAVTRFTEASATLAQADASSEQAALNVELAEKKIEQAETQLADAQYDLSQTTVLAPEDGYATNVQLYPGMSVGGATGAVMTFVLDSNAQDDGIVVAAFNQKNFLRIKEGHYCEVALFGYPGEIFTGRVINAIDISGAGQLQASGVLPSDLGAKAPAQFAVRIKLDKEDLRLPGGSQAQVAVYTENMQIAGIPVMFLIRTQSWIRYLM